MPIALSVWLNRAGSLGSRHSFNVRSLRPHETGSFRAGAFSRRFTPGRLAHRIPVLFHMKSVAAARPPARPWLFNPGLDLLVGCGGWSLPLLVITFYLTQHETVYLSFPGFISSACS